MGNLDLPKSLLYNNPNPFDNLLFLFLKTSPGTLVIASLIGSILQAFICGVLTVLVSLFDQLGLKSLD
jgi:hypothetical protein